jgi:hypothetical protein
MPLWQGGARTPLSPQRRFTKYTPLVSLEFSAALGATFGLLAGACAYVISYGEYKRNWSFRGSAAKMALRSALVTFLFFFLAALALPLIFRLVRL